MKRKGIIKPRNFLVVPAKLRKADGFVDRKKQASKEACRKRVMYEN